MRYWKSILYLHPLRETDDGEIEYPGTKFLISKYFLESIAGSKISCTFAPAKTRSDFKTRSGKAEKNRKSSLRY